MLKKIVIILIFGLIFLTGCGTSEEGQDEKQKEAVKEQDTESTLYEKNGLVVSGVSGWTVGTEKENPISVTFNHENVKAIVSVVETDKSIKQLKNELLAGAGDVEIIEDQKQYFSYKSKQKESIRTDIYMEEKDGRTMILSFLAKTDVYKDVKGTIETFQSAVKLNK